MLYQKKQIPLSVMSLVAISLIGVTVFMQHRWNQTIDFSAKTVIMPTFRSADGAIQPPVYSEQQILDMVAMLNDTVADEYKKASQPKFKFTFRPRTEYRIETTVQEVFGGGLAVDVKAYSFKDDTLAKEWTEEFDNNELYLEAVQTVGSQIAGDLAQLRK
jgi:preprotein translocase subunit SecF